MSNEKRQKRKIDEQLKNTNKSFEEQMREIREGMKPIYDSDESTKAEEWIKFRQRFQQVFGNKTSNSTSNSSNVTTGNYDSRRTNQWKYSESGTSATPYPYPGPQTGTPGVSTSPSTSPLNPPPSPFPVNHLVVVQLQEEVNELREHIKLLEEKFDLLMDGIEYMQMMRG